MYIFGLKITRCKKEDKQEIDRLLSVVKTIKETIMLMNQHILEMQRIQSMSSKVNIEILHRYILQLEELFNQYSFNRFSSPSSEICIAERIDCCKLIYNNIRNRGLRINEIFNEENITDINLIPESMLIEISKIRDEIIDLFSRMYHETIRLMNVFCEDYMLSPSRVDPLDYTKHKSKIEKECNKEIEYQICYKRTYNSNSHIENINKENVEK